MNEETNKHFKNFTNKFFKQYLDLTPDHAVSLGLHEYDGIMEDVSLSGIEKEKVTLELLYKDLQQIEYDKLVVENKFDYDLIEWSIESILFGVNEIAAHKRNPMTYALMFTNMGNYLYRDYAPFEERLKAVMNIMKDIPNVIENAKINLDKSVPEIFCKYAKRFTSGYEDFFKNELMNEIEAKEINKTLVEEYKELCNSTVTAFNDYINFIDEVLIPNSNDDFRLGKEKFEKMLKVKEHIDISIPELKKLGEDELERLETQYAEVTKGKSNIEKFVDDHPTEDNLIKETDDTLHELVKFINEKNIVNIPDNLNCIVKEMPHYMKVGFAAMATAGPFEKSDESFYFVSLPDKQFNEQKRKEWMTLFNYPTLKLISIHEAFPGHYTHFLNSNLHASKISKLFMSYTYTEGWAHYTEEMMIDEGYGKDDYQIKLAQIIEAIVRCCRYLAAIGLHYDNMTIDEAIELFKNHAKLSPTTATQEAERGAFDPGYLSYTLGKIMLKNLKKDFFAKYNGKHSLKDFHNKIVSLGAPTYKIASKYLLNDTVT
jgi:uncharacterized protein (DUF885 family)